MGNNQESRERMMVWWTGFLSRKIQYGLDLAVLVISFTFAYLFRFDFNVPPDHVTRGLIQLPIVVLIQFVALVLAGVHSFIWRYTGMSEVRAFVNAGCWWLVPLLLMRFAVPESYGDLRVPVSVILMDAVLAFGGVLSLRVLRRALYERYEKRQKAAHAPNGHKKPVLLIGAGRAGVLAAKEIFGRGDTELEVKGFVDDDKGKHGQVIQGIKVYGSTEEVPRLVRELGIDHVVITIAEASAHDIRRILRVCEQVPIKVRIIPGLYEILQGSVQVTRIRDVQIEDLLGRESVHLDEGSIGSFLAGKTVMVTGAGGSIGSELARQVARFQPNSLLLVERAEFALFTIDRELRGEWPDLSIIPMVADVGDEGRMRSIFSAHHPEVVLHAAAHKHVPMMESNMAEAVKNNVLATRIVGELAGQFGVDVFVLISTDKAVRPTSVMGASKRVAELCVQALNRQFRTRYVAVRFGNVIGSAGSVITIFREQIRRGGPITVTHPDMVRYFMTIPEAAQLVLQAGAMGEGGEIFVLDMGEPVRIFELAKDIISLSGLKPYEDIDIIFTGVRPGEKLFEELEMSEECLAKTRHPKIFIGKIAAYPEQKVDQALRRLKDLSSAGSEQEMRAFLSALLPEATLTCDPDVNQEVEVNGLDSADRGLLRPTIQEAIP
jgi:FlaA1/EpsC-like NDP-sugar epimerase